LRLGSGDAGRQETGEFVYDGSVANRALELLGKEIGMFIDRSLVSLGSRAAADPPTQSTTVDVSSLIPSESNGPP